MTDKEMIASRCGTVRDRSLRKDGGGCQVEPRNLTYERNIASRCGTVRDRSLRKDGQNDGLSIVILSETKDLDDGNMKERFFAKEAQNDTSREPTPLQAWGDEFVILSETKDLDDGNMKERFFAKEAQNDRSREPTPDQVWGDEFVILSETKELDGGKMKERFFAKEAQNDRMSTPSLRDAPSQEGEGVKALPRRGTALRGGSCGLPFTSSTTTWSPFSKEKAKGRIALPLRTIIIFLLMLLPVSAVGGQEPTTRLFFNPTPLVIDTTTSPSGVVTLEVADGVDIFAFDVFVQYDPALVTVSQVTLGGFLGDGLLCMDQVNEPGLVHYACTRWNVNTGVSGLGVLLELTFEAFGQGGDTTLSLGGSELYDWPNAFVVDATLEGGAVSVRPFRTYLPLLIAGSGQGMGAER